MEDLTYGYPAALLAQLTGVQVDTARRWKRTGKVRARQAQRDTAADALEAPVTMAMRS